MTPPTSTPGVDSGSPAGGVDYLVIALIERAERAAERRALERTMWALRAEAAMMRLPESRAGIYRAETIVQRLYGEVRP